MKPIENNILVGDFYSNIAFSDELEKKWQEIVDLTANILKVPSALIMRVKPPYIEVFKTSNTSNNPYKAGDKNNLFGLYCETAIKTQRELLVTNALKDDSWNANPDIQSGMISYLGYPINFPDQTPFGTICVLDTKENSYNESFKKLLIQFKSVIELDLKIHIDSYKATKSLNDDLLELKTLSTAVNQSDNVVVITDEKGIIEYVNPKFTEVTGYTKEEAIGKNPRILKSGFFDKTQYKQLWRSIKTGNKWTGEFLNTKKDGTTYWERASIYPLRNDKNKIVNFVAIKDDITANKKDQEALIQAGKIWDNIPIGIFIFELENADEIDSLRIVSANPATFSILSDSTNDIANQKLYSAFPGLIGTDIPEKFANVIRNKKSISIDDFQYSEDNAPTGYFSIKAFPLQDNKAVVSFENITEKKETENLLKQKFDFIEFTNEISSSLINIPTSQIDHEINTVLEQVSHFVNAIRGYVYQWSDDEKTLELINEWSKDTMGYRRSKLPSIIDPNYHLLFHQLGQITHQLSGNTEIESKFESSTQKALRQLKIGSFISIGLFQNQNLIGIIGFDFEEADIEIPQSIIDILYMSTNVISNAKGRLFADKQLKESEKLFRHITENNSYGISIVQDAKFVYGNNKVYEIYDLTPDELIGKGLKSVLSGSSVTLLKEELNTEMERGATDHTEMEICTLKGKRLIVSIHRSEILYKGKKASISIHEDITERKKSESLLKASEEKWKSLVTNIPNSISVVNKEGYVTFLNRTLSGRDVVDIIGKKVEEVWQGTSIELVIENHKKVFSTGQTQYFESNYSSIDEDLWYFNFLSPIYKDDQVHSVIMISSDITGQKKVAEQLKISEERHKIISKVSSDYVYSATPDKNNILRLEWVSGAFTIISGYTKDEIDALENGWESIILPEDRHSNNNSTNILDELLLAKTEEYRIITKSGVIKWISDSYVPMTNKSDSSNISYLGSVTDITERKIAEKALIKSEEKFSRIFDLSYGIVAIINEKNQKFVDANLGLTKILGYSREEVIGKTTLEIGFWPDENIHKREIFCKEYEKDQGFAYMESELRKKDGQFIQCELSAKRIEFNGEAHLFIAVNDITEAKKAEAQIKEHNQALITLNKQMAEYKMMALRSAMNPHFVFNCLNSIQFFIAGNDKRSAISYLSLFSKLIRNVLDSSVNQYTTLEKEIETLKYYIELEKLRFDDKFRFNLCLDEDLDTDEIEIPSLIIQPYIENAIIHGLTSREEKGTLLLEISSHHDKLLCVIEDDGIGRKKSESFNISKKLAHKSVGMSVTEERLNIVNKTNEVSVNIIDLEEDGEPCGTRVELLINIGKNKLL